MVLLIPQKEYRTVWMFPRNIRYIEPWKLNSILSAITAFKSIDLTDRLTQDALYASLADLGVKSKSQTRDKNPGGMRTYYAQLRCLGLMYGQGQLTVAGKEILAGNNPLHVLQTQLLRHQYPSAYGSGQNVRIHPKMRIKPFIFIIQLLTDPKIQRLSVLELMIPVIYGHSHACLNLCIEKILTMRSSGITSLNELSPLIPYEDIYLPKGGWKFDEIPSESQKIKQLENIRDIANTAGNYLKAAQLVRVVEENGLRLSYEFNDEIEALYQAEKNQKFIGADQDEEAFQRAFGRYLKNKDTAKQGSEKQSGVLSFIQTLYLNEKKAHLFGAMDIRKFAKAQSKKWGIAEDLIVNAVESLVPNVKTLEHDLYLDYSNSGTEHALDFEKATAAILKNLGFDETIHIGQKKAPASRRGGYPDICFKRSGEAFCGLADTKATNVFTISDTDELKLTTYYLNSNKDFYPESELSCYLYVAGNFKKSMTTHTEKLSQSIQIPITAIRAKALLDLYENRQGRTLEDIISILKSGTVIENC